MRSDRYIVSPMLAYVAVIVGLLLFGLTGCANHVQLMADRCAEAGYPLGSVENLQCVQMQEQAYSVNAATSASMLDASARLLGNQQRVPSTTSCQWVGKNLICNRF